MLVAAGYMLVVLGIVLAALSFINFLLSSGPIIGTGTLAALEIGISLQGVAIGLGVAGIGLALLRLRQFKLSEGGRLEAASGTGWAFVIGAVLGALLVGGGGYWFTGVWDDVNSPPNDTFQLEQDQDSLESDTIAHSSIPAPGLNLERSSDIPLHPISDPSPHYPTTLLLTEV